MRRFRDEAIHSLTQALRHVHPRFPLVKHWPGVKPVVGGIFKRAIRPGSDAISWQLARLHRRRLGETIFVGVTGSAGKTTTKFMIGAVLSSRFTGGFTKGTRNNKRSAAQSVLQHASKGDDFHVVELSAARPGALDPQLELIAPQIGVVTNIGTDHYSAYGSLEAIAAEKGKLPRCLPPTGVAVLNADDPRVLAMRDGCCCRVVTFGVASDAMVRGHNVAASWPESLSFDVSYEGQTVRVRTELVGSLWVSGALAAIATGVALDVPLATAAAALSHIEPNPGRMSAITLPDGVSFLRDDWKASVHTIPIAFNVLRDATAARKVAVIGTIADTMGDAGRTYVTVARQALEIADLVCFVGPRAFAAMRAQPDDPTRLHAFGTVRAAKEFLDKTLRSGDLVLLKGSNSADHLYRVLLGRTQPVECWRMDCGRQGYCDRCELVGVPSGSGDSQLPTGAVSERRPSSTVEPLSRRDGNPAVSIVVGLGNPGAHLAQSAHNIGFAVVDRLASMHHVKWRDVPDASLGVVEWEGPPVWLLKSQVPINRTGGVLYSLSQEHQFDAVDCILVYDDLDLPFGAVRTRLRGSDGGHRGVRSILESFQTDQFRRVKIGVKRPEPVDAKQAVLSTFNDDERRLISKSIDEACKRILEMITQSRRDSPPTPAPATVGHNADGTPQ